PRVPPHTTRRRSRPARRPPRGHDWPMIRDTFQPELDEFIGDLESYATGSYLTEEDRENWFEPFDSAAATEVRDVVERYFDALDALAAQREPASQEALLAAVDRVTADLNAVNAA